MNAHHFLDVTGKAWNPRSQNKKVPPKQDTAKSRYSIESTAVINPIGDKRRVMRLLKDL
jgi:hypothetical protein